MTVRRGCAADARASAAVVRAAPVALAGEKVLVEQRVV